MSGFAAVVRHPDIDCFSFFIFFGRKGISDSYGSIVSRMSGKPMGS